MTRGVHCGRLFRAFLPVLLLCVVFARHAQAQAPRTHFVDVGLNGTTTFTDRDTGKNNFTVSPVPTVVQAGDSVQWVFHYGHSSTSGSCPNGFCTPNGIWDSTILNGPPQIFQRAFSTTGVFPYFCLVHLSAMQGKVVVLNGPDFFLEVTNPPSQTAPPLPLVTIAAGNSGTFTGNISGFLDYKSPVTFSCQNGNPRVPSACPTVTVTPDGKGNPIAFNVAVADSVPGNYDFDIVGVGADPTHLTHSQRVRLTVVDFTVGNLSPSAITVPPGAASSQVSLQVSANNFSGGFVSMLCEGLPPNNTLFCGFAPQFFFIPPPPPQPPPTNVTLNINNFGASPGQLSIAIVASTFINNSNLIASVPLSVTVVGPATHFGVPTPLNSVKKSTPISIALTAQDLLNSTVTNYTGTVHFSSTDPAATLPANTAFSLGDNGVHNFPVTFNTLGPRAVTANDVSSPQIQWQSPVILVQPSGPANNTLALSSDRGPGNEAFFRRDLVNLEIIVTGASTPTGKVHLYDGLKEMTPAAGVTLSTVNGTTAHAIVPVRMPPGARALTVVYDGGGGFGANVSAFSQSRSPAPRCVNNVCPGSH